LSVLVLAAIRTPLGALGGALKPLRAPQLGALVIRAALDRAGLAADAMDEVVFGCAFQAGMGPNPARQAALGAGLAPETPAWTLNQLCGSGLMAVAQAARGLSHGPGRFAVAGGFESHSNAPYLLPSARWGQRMGETELRDCLLDDGPGWFQDEPIAEFLARDGEVPADSPGLLPVQVPGRRGPVLVTRDAWTSGPRTGQAPPADGAAALVLAAESAAGGRQPLGRILGFSSGPRALENLAVQAGLAAREIHPFPAPDHLLAVGGAPLLVDLLRGLRGEGRRHGSITLASGDGQALSMLLELC